MSKPHDIDRLLRDLRAGKFSYRIMDEAADCIADVREVKAAPKSFDDTQ
jgi:hypothetical protein